MGFEFFKESYAGSVKEIALGKGDSAVTVGGETCYPFYQFEGDMPHKPRIAMEIWDMAPEEWPAAALEPFKDVVSDPAAWAKKCVEEYGADIIVLQLKSTDPKVQRFLGVSPGNGKALGLDEKWAYNIVKMVGNYGEVFERNVGVNTPLGIERGLNALWTDGGLMYSPPFK